MITNCLDVDKNTWDNQTTVTYTSGDHTDGTITSSSTLNNDGEWSGGANGPYTNNLQSPGNQELSYLNSAQNCHRETDNDGTDGWNKITPW